jgi:hypothetical protein
MKYILVALLFFVPQLSFAYTYTRTPSGTDITNPLTLTLETDSLDINNAGSFTVTYNYEGTGAPSMGSITSVCYTTNYTVLTLYTMPISFSTFYTPDVYYPINFKDIVLDTYDSSDCGLGYNGTVFLEGDGNSTIFTMQTAPTNGFIGILNSGETVFQNTTGATMGATVAWAGDSFIKIILGSGLAVLLALRYWIVALIIISLVVYFSYKYKLFANKI